MSASDPAIVAGEDTLIDLLAAIYRRVDWASIGGKSVLDIWSGRLLVASRAPTLAAAVDRLCGLLGIRAMPEEAVSLLAICRTNEADLLDILAEETRPIAMQAYVAVKAARKAKPA